MGACGLSYQPCVASPTLRRKRWRRTLRRCRGYGRPEMRAFGLRLAFLAAFAAPLAVEAETLKVVEVNAPAVNCVFRTTCRIPVTDSVSYPPELHCNHGNRLAAVAQLHGRTRHARRRQDRLSLSHQPDRGLRLGGMHRRSCARLRPGGEAPVPDRGYGRR